MHAVIVPVEGDPELVHFEEDNCLSVLQDAVHGYVEKVRLTPSCDMWVNEKYRIMSPSPPINKVATHLYQVHRGGDFILGDVIFTGPCDQEGNTLGLNDIVVTTLMHIKKIDAAQNN
jgi:hypothetical protein